MDEWRTQPPGGLAQRVREARGRLAPDRAASALGLSTDALEQIESGERDATVGQLLGASGLYGVELRSLLFGRPAADPALAHLGLELAELVQEYLRERYGAERVDDLDDGQLDDVNRVIGQVQRFGGLVEGLLRRQGGGRQLDELARALQRIEHLVERAPGRPQPPQPAGQRQRRFRFEPRGADSLRAHHGVYREALEWYDRTAGRVSDDETGFQRLLPWLQILVPTAEGFPYLYCGERTPPAELWGEAFARTLVGQFGLPDAALDRATAQAFLGVQQRATPLLEAASGPVLVEGVTRLDSWHRFVMPLQFRGLACIASLAVRDHHRQRASD